MLTIRFLFFFNKFFILIDWGDVLGFLIRLLSYISICSFTHMAFNNFPGLWKRCMLCVLYMHYFFFPLVKLTGPWKGRVLFMTICTRYIFAFTLSVWFESLSPHFPHTWRPLQISLWCPNFWHLKHRRSSWYKLLYPHQSYKQSWFLLVF